jgi:hypothetical protein
MTELPASTLPTEAFHFHVGIIVTDFAAAQDRLSELLGVEWGRVLELDAYEVELGDGSKLTVPNKMCYSTGDPHLELIQEVPGTPWVTNEHSNLHHIGFWSGDLAGESARFSATGCPLAMRGRDGDRAPISFAYHDDPLGVRIELLDDSLRPTIESFLFAKPE